jgi:transformation/transcription domain-associated protein
MNTLMLLLRTDNEDNAVICLKIITDLHKMYKVVLESFVQPFLDIVKEMFNNMDQAITDTFSNGGGDTDMVSSNTPFNTTNNSSNSSNNDESGVPGSTQQRRSHIPKSLFSFKVLTECPIIIALLFQVHKKFVNPNVADLVPCIIKAIALQPAQQKAAHDEAAANNTIFVGVSPLIKNRAAFSELKALQVKTVSFFAYILKGYMSIFKPHAQTVADCVVGLMKDTPPEASATRKVKSI